MTVNTVVTVVGIGHLDCVTIRPEKKGQLTEMHSQLNSGLLFNLAPELLLKAWPSVTSESDLLVKIARIRKSDPNITHDFQIFREFRKGTLTQEKLTDFFSDSIPLTQPPLVKAQNRKSIGAWYIVKSMLVGYKSALASDSSALVVLDFIDAHCEIEQQTISEYQKSGNVDLLNAFLIRWLKLEEIQLANPSKALLLIYIINMVMYWAALIELLIEQEIGSDKLSVLNRILPQTGKRGNNHYFHPSTEQLLEVIRRKWGAEQYGKERVTWQVLFTDIKKRQLTDPGLTNPVLEEGDIRLIEPNVGDIKKRIQRWRKGDLFKAEDIKESLLILLTPTSTPLDYINYVPYYLVNLFTYLQIQLIQEDYDPEAIAEHFESYSKITALVKTRFQIFEKTGELVD